MLQKKYRYIYGMQTSSYNLLQTILILAHFFLIFNSHFKYLSVFTFIPFQFFLLFKKKHVKFTIALFIVSYTELYNKYNDTYSLPFLTIQDFFLPLHSNFHTKNKPPYFYSLLLREVFLYRLM